MDWFGVDVPIYYDIDPTDAAMDWLALAPAALVLAVAMIVVIFALWGERRRAFWCALAGREVVTVSRYGCLWSCTAFENPRAISCARRCKDADFRRRWPPALPVIGLPAGRG